MYKFFFLYEVEVLDSFYFSFGLDKVDVVDVVYWIKIAFVLYLRILVFEFFIYLYEVDEFIFTSSLCICDILVILKFGSLIFVDIFVSGSMKFFKTLYFIYAFYINDEFICNFLFGCFRFEEFVVERFCEYSVKFFIIKVFFL